MYNGDFIINNNVLLKYRGKDATVNVPDSIVTIGANAFQDCKTMVYVNFREL